MQPAARYRSYERAPQAPKRKKRWPKLLAIVVILIILVAGGTLLVKKYGVTAKPESSISSSAKSSNQAQKSPAVNNSQAAVPAANHCAGNTLANLVLVSISQQHMWACGGSQQLYDSAVVTGMEMYPADLTPTGTYHIYGKQTNLTLNGSDSTGSWSDPVSYWMPFLDNQYGEYGFHDATWRSPSEFGTVNINNPYTATEHGSHGCVELPLATAKWLYNWVPVGTTVTIES